MVRWAWWGPVLALAAIACNHGVGDDDLEELPLADAPCGCVGEVTEMVTSAMVLPTAETVRELSFDFDGVENPNDNALVPLLARLSELGVELQPAVTAAIQSGWVITLHALTAEAFVGSAGWQTFEAGSASPSPPRFDGNDTFTRADVAPPDWRVIGFITSGTFDGGPGNQSLSIALADLQRVTLPLIGARVRAGVSATGAVAGVFGGALRIEDIDGLLVPSLAVRLTSELATDCAGAPAAILDTDMDCVITPTELRADPAFHDALELDLDMLNGDRFGPGQDGQPDCLSLAVGFTAVAAEFDRPGE